MKKILYIDMDNVIVNFKSGIDRLSLEVQTQYEGNLDEVPGIFALMDPMDGAVESVKQLSERYDTYVLSTAPWANPSAWSDKVKWIHQYFGEQKETPLYKRLILSHHKHLNDGHYLIDDRLANGAGDFKGMHIHFGQEDWPDWKTVTQYLLNQ
jgi:5'-nucleotidase